MARPHSACELQELPSGFFPGDALSFSYFFYFALVHVEAFFPYVPQDFGFYCPAESSVSVVIAHKYVALITLLPCFRVQVQNYLLGQKH